MPLNNVTSIQINRQRAEGRVAYFSFAYKALQYVFARKKLTVIFMRFLSHFSLKKRINITVKLI